MRRLILISVMMLGLALPKAYAQQSDIVGVISSQIDAFKMDDFATAFEYAHPNIQNMFRTPENFGRMVSQGYPMVWRPSDVQFLDLRQDNGATFQDVQVVDSKGRVFVLEYSMTQTAEGWLISGVRILDSMELSA